MSGYAPSRLCSVPGTAPPEAAPAADKAYSRMCSISGLWSSCAVSEQPAEAPSAGYPAGAVRIISDDGEEGDVKGSPPPSAPSPPAARAPAAAERSQGGSPAAHAPPPPSPPAAAPPAPAPRASPPAVAPQAPLAPPPGAAPPSPASPAPASPSLAASPLRRDQSPPHAVVSDKRNLVRELRKEAERLMGLEHWEAAEIVLTEALTHAALESQLYGLRADCIGRQARPNDAVEDAERATSLAPEWGPGHATLGAVLEAAGRQVEAAAAWERAGALCEGAIGEAAKAKAAALRAELAAAPAAAPAEQLAAAAGQLRVE